MNTLSQSVAVRRYRSTSHRWCLLVIVLIFQFLILDLTDIARLNPNYFISQSIFNEITFCSFRNSHYRLCITQIFIIQAPQQLPISDIYSCFCRVLSKLNGYSKSDMNTNIYSNQARSTSEGNEANSTVPPPAFASNAVPNAQRSPPPVYGTNVNVAPIIMQSQQQFIQNGMVTQPQQPFATQQVCFSKIFVLSLEHEKH